MALFNAHSFIKWLRNNPAKVAVYFMIFICLSLPTVDWWLEKDVEGSNIKTIQDGWWYGIVTMLTVGYGDRYPVTPLGRLVGSLVMISGVVGMSIVTARISSIFLEQALRDRRGLVDTDELEGHFIVCGWKSEMHTLLSNILQSSGMNSSQLVLVNNVDDSSIDALHEFPKLKGFKYFKGEFFQMEILKRAAPERAQKILILADATPEADGSIPSKTVADARTVMAAMILANIAKGTPVAAEVLDTEMEQYLRLAHVNEIIYSKEYSRMLVAMASTGTGVTNIFHELIDPRSTHMMTTVPIKNDFINKDYLALKKHIEATAPEHTLIGILENSGNSHNAKELALKKAQMTPDIQKLVSNLQGVKNLKFNQPVFTPKNDYKIPEGAMAIIIKNRSDNALSA